MKTSKHTEKKSWLYQILIATNIYALLFIYGFLIFLLLLKCLFQYSLPHLILYFIVGMLIWSLLEYGVHRFVFHGERKLVLLQKLQFFMHGYHHIQPRDPNRLVLPIILTLPITIVAYLTLGFLFPNSGILILLGVLFGYLSYDISHYMIHRTQPVTRIGKYRRVHHYHHHFRDATSCFGVTTPLWDILLGTHKSQKMN